MIVTSRSGGHKFLTATLPDTITSWSASAWAINTRDGLGVADPAMVVAPFINFVCLGLHIYKSVSHCQVSQTRDTDICAWILCFLFY